jgi:hypothetical protein
VSVVPVDRGCSSFADVPPRTGDVIDDEGEGKRDRDETPDTPPTEPEPVPIKEPPPPPDKRGPVIVLGV